MSFQLIIKVEHRVNLDLKASRFNVNASRMLALPKLLADN